MRFGLADRGPQACELTFPPHPESTASWRQNDGSTSSPAWPPTPSTARAAHRHLSGRPARARRAAAAGRTDHPPTRGQLPPRPPSESRAERRLLARCPQTRRVTERNPIPGATPRRAPIPYYLSATGSVWPGSTERAVLAHRRAAKGARDRWSRQGSGLQPTEHVSRQQPLRGIEVQPDGVGTGIRPGGRPCNVALEVQAREAAARADTAYRPRQLSVRRHPALEAIDEGS